MNILVDEKYLMDALEGEYDEFYDDYVAGKKELTEINREYSAEYAGTGIDE